MKWQLCASIIAMLFLATGLQAQDITCDLPDNTVSSGFTVRNGNGDILFTVRGDGHAGYPDFQSGTRLLIEGGTEDGLTASTAAREGIGLTGIAESGSGSNIGVLGISRSPTGLAGAFHGRLYVRDKVGIGTDRPDAELHVEGRMLITGGNPGAGRVLTSDARGFARWEELSAGAGNTLNDAYNQGGAGEGRTIIADAGAVTIAGVDGLLATGKMSAGTIPMEGPGTRMMWYPGMASFRAGTVSSTEWDASNQGRYSFAAGNDVLAGGAGSVAMGFRCSAIEDNAVALGHGCRSTGRTAFSMGRGNVASGSESVAFGSACESSGLNAFTIGASTIASGQNSVSMGAQSEASGSNSLAMGYQSIAGGTCAVAMGFEVSSTGHSSFALGRNARATEEGAVAIGVNVSATGYRSTALGNHMNTNGQQGAFMIGDNSTAIDFDAFGPQVFISRFAGGYSLFTNADCTTQAILLPNSHSWGAFSDSTKKENFLATDSESVLNSFRGLRLGTWNYIGNTQRHYGPMAQEWFAAFGHDGIGAIGNDTVLITVDMIGVLCIAVQALEQRTEHLDEARAAVTDLTGHLRAAQEEIDALRTQLQRVEKEMNTLEQLHARIDALEKNTPVPESEGQDLRQLSRSDERGAAQ
ncbi:MAG: tail fiber domain-containing protein [Bacteroidetes bacterium]|nr:tail fiber domain-containing protein [Bacteroidota bacterium]